VDTIINIINVADKKYLNSRNLQNLVNRYINKLDEFTSATYDGRTVRKGRQYTKKSLEIALDANRLTADQKKALDGSKAYGKSLGITVTVVNYQ
jgi:hypothetical protein